MSDVNDMPEWLPDNPCSDEAHQMMIQNCETEEQAKITAYMSGYFDAEGSVIIPASIEPSNDTGHSLKCQLRVQTAVMQMAGLFDGEGCIKATPSPQDKNKIGYSMQPSTKVHQNDNNSMTEAIFERYCSIYNVSYATRYQQARDEDRKPTVLCSVNGTNDIRAFLAPLIPVLYEKQRQAVIMLRDIIPALERGVHLTKPGFIEVMKMKRELDKEKPMSDEDRKYTVEYFEDLWGDQIEEQQAISDFATVDGEHE
jgi:hypothetical protein